jgi:dsDNA-binding SOS-regulon protein
MQQGIFVSTTMEIEYGVPQGSILGPILFSLYTNDLSLNIMGSKIVLFADDTNILVSEANMKNFQCKLNNVMNELQIWFTQNSLVVNDEKRLAMPFHTAQNKKPLLPQVIFEGRDIP